MRGTHGEKIVSALESDKLPKQDKSRLQKAIIKYDEWVNSLNTIKSDNLDILINKLVKALNDYKYYIDVDVIFDSKQDFLYRQKG